VKARNIPLVFFDRTNDKLRLPSVVIDDFKGAFLAAEHVIGQGYKRIAHITGAENIKIWNTRLKGYKKVLAYKIPFDPNLKNQSLIRKIILERISIFKDSSIKK